MGADGRSSAIRRGCGLDTSDGHDVYPPAVEEHFGADIDFAQCIKNYSPPRTDGPDWFRPSARVVSTTAKRISGNPKLARVTLRRGRRLGS